MRNRDQRVTFVDVDKGGLDLVQHPRTRVGKWVERHTGHVRTLSDRETKKRDPKSL